MSKNTNTYFSTLDYILIAVTAFMLISSWLYVSISYNKLPSEIAVHFDGLGKPNGYASKNNIWLAPAIFTILSASFILGAKYQKIFNFSKQKPSLQEEQSNLKVMLFSALLLALLTPLIVYSMVKGSLIKNFEMPWILPIISSIVLIYLISIFYYKFKTLKS